MSKRLRKIFSVVASVLVVSAVISIPQASAQTGFHCTRYAVPVSLLPGAPADQTISGDLCLPESGAATSVQLLVPGATYNSSYWNFPVTQYSYAKDMVDGGHAVFAVDRLNTGNSSKAAPLAVTVDADAYTMHQVVGALKAGQVGGHSFSKVVITGHSLGSIISVKEAGVYHDVDGVILTGYGHFPNLAGLPDYALLQFFGPIRADDPSPSPYIKNQPAGELTTEPGARQKYFYSEGDYDPAILKLDEDTKDVSTVGEFTSVVELITGPSNLITAPVFMASAEHDATFNCGLDQCHDATTLKNVESLRFTGTPSFETFVLPGSGHSMNLASNAHVFFDAASSWIDRHIGS
jgi:pimeloyl-ACP methyl ester carboxylesterase